MKLRVYNDTLDPNIWNENKSLKPDVKDVLLKIAEDFYNSTDLTGDIQNILFLGSVANYNWTPSSDIDLHIVIDISGEKINEEYARKFMDGLALKWNTDHDIEISGHPVEVYIQDTREPNSTVQQARPNVAIYSIFDDSWMIEPNRLKIDLDADKIREKYQTLKKKIKNLVETEDIEKLKDLMKSIRNYRNAGLAKGGEFSVENLVFKALRHTGELKTMKDAINTIYDKKVSLPEDGNIQPDKKTEPLNEVILKYGQLIIGLMDENEVINVQINALGNHHGKGIRWRYKYPYPVIFWWHKPTEDQKQILTNYFKDKFNIIIKEHVVGFDCGFDDMASGVKTFHALHEPKILGLYRTKSKIKENLIDKNAKLFLGFIKRENLKVVGTSISDENVCDEHGNCYSHTDFLMELGPEWSMLWDNEIIPWRYKPSTNTIYWWAARSNPNEDEKNEVEFWVEKNARAKYPEHKQIGNFDTALKADRDAAHNINEVDGQPFLVVGNVNDDLEVTAQIDYKGAGLTWSDTTVTHSWRDDMRWRYKSKTNTIYWSWGRDKVEEKIIDVVLDYLHDKYSVVNPKHNFGTKEYTTQAHYVNESNRTPFLVVGNVNDDLEIKAEIDYKGSSRYWSDTPVVHHWPGGVDWRYKLKTNTIYWRVDEGCVMEQQKDAVMDYLYRKYSVTDPINKYYDDDYSYQGHYVNEMMILTKLLLSHPLSIKKSKKE